MPIADALLTITVLLVAAHLAGGVMLRLGLPAVIGELLAGVVLGGLWLGSIRPEEPLYVFAEVGLILLMVEVGMDTDATDLLHAGRQAVVTGLMAIGLPFVGVLLVAQGMGLTSLEAVMIAAALSTTGVTVLVRILREADALASPVASLLVGIALLADLAGLVILGVVRQVAEAGSADWIIVIRATAISIFFLLGALLLGGRLTGFLARLADWLPADGAALVLSIGFALGLGVAARFAGSAIIVGAFAAGILLSRTAMAPDLKVSLRPVGEIFIPLFFAIAGTGVGLGAAPALAGDGPFLLVLAAALSVVVVSGKLVAGLVVRRRGIRRLTVALGLVPCGAVGIAFAEVGRQTGVLTEPLFSVTMVVVLLTTFVGAPLFRLALR